MFLCPRNAAMAAAAQERWQSVSHESFQHMRCKSPAAEALTQGGCLCYLDWYCPLWKWTPKEDRLVI